MNLEYSINNYIITDGSYNKSTNSLTNASYVFGFSERGSESDTKFGISLKFPLPLKEVKSLMSTKVGKTGGKIEIAKWSGYGSGNPSSL